MTSRPTFSAVASRYATRQHGVVTRAQLLGDGIGRSAIDRHLRCGRLRRLHRGVYLYGPLPLPLTDPMAATLACGSESYLSHRSAAVLWELVHARRGSSRIDVTTRGIRRRRPGIRVRRTRSLPDDDVTLRHAIPVTTPVRTLVDLAADVRAVTLERAISQGVARRLLDEDELRRRALGRRGTRGIGTLRNVLGLAGPAFTRSDAEAGLLALVRRARLPEPETNVVVAGHEVDLYWPRRRLAVEVDGRAYHSSSRSFERDRRRDADLASRGIRVIRVTWKQMTTEREAVIARLGGAVLAHPVRAD